ncbi:hypothetical protein Fmac_031289 [Flemingia macrophylla]|uniref:GDSL esterase/lipase n=1 Tax=Flemingia macrophylla TaxID=520843 RepID=A0ABD1L1L9_9FABA
MSNTLAIPKFSSILVFGDSLVDTGNNNYIQTHSRADHAPYGKDFPGHVPTGRFSNGKLFTDFLASQLNLKDIVPPYLDPNLSPEELLTGVSFASGGSGIDELTSTISLSIPLSKQVENFKAYVLKLNQIVGENQTQQILRDALVVFCAGQNDLIVNFYDLSGRRLMFGDNISKYEDYLLDKLQIFIEDLYHHGCRNFGVAGIGSIGCMPSQITAMLESNGQCVMDENNDCMQYNQKLMQRLPQIQNMLPASRLVYVDMYTPLLNLINNPEKYGEEY